MVILRTTVRLNMRSGVDTDAAVNVWHWNDPIGATSGPQATTMATHLATFYQSMNGRMSMALQRTGNAHTITFAEVDAGSPGAGDDTVTKVLFTRDFNIGGTPGGPPKSLPSEVAVCLSFRGDITDIPEESGLTRPASRKRGRVFLGPWNDGVLFTDATTGTSSFQATQAQEIVDYYQVLVAAMNSMVASPVKHIVYSPKNGTFSEVTQVHVDTAFDTIRNRGVPSLVRATEVVTQT